VGQQWVARGGRGWSGERWERLIHVEALGGGRSRRRLAASGWSSGQLLMVEAELARGGGGA
jgi:hypothetical protein